jgi:ADP-heptose:LPS heptosyltransferase
MNGRASVKRTSLVIHPGAVGDVLLARQAIRAVREAYPDHELGLLVRRDVGTLLCDCREATRCFPLEGGALTGLLAGAEAVLPDLRQWLGTCDLAVCWMDDPGGLRATLRTFGVAQVVMPSASGGTQGLHQADHLLRTLEGIARLNTAAGRLELPDAVGDEGRTALVAQEIPERRFVVIHPGSGSPHKCVAPEVLATVADELCRQGIPVVLAEGPADEARVRDVADLCAAKPCVVRGQELVRMADILAHAALFIGHDSGLTHLAAALDIPTVALFGPTDANRWVPRGASVAVLSGLPCRCDGWDMVRGCAEKPCLRIAPDRILAACHARLPAAASEQA